LPPDRKINLGAVSYDISTVAQNGAVEVKRNLTVNGVVFTKEEYPTLRRFFGIVKTNDNTQMVLQNAASAKNN
jgi:predicted transcriptional regulator